MCRPGVSVFQCLLFMFCPKVSSEATPAFCGSQVGTPSNFIRASICGLFNLHNFANAINGTKRRSMDKNKSQ